MNQLKRVRYPGENNGVLGLWGPSWSVITHKPVLPGNMSTGAQELPRTQPGPRLFILLGS